ncbi:MAG: transcriptional repressor [Pseudomonadota bacterium]
MTKTHPGLAMQAHDHADCVARVLAQVEEISAGESLNVTPVRRRVLELLLESHAALGAYDILRRLDEDGLGSQPPVAYRALDFLVGHGFVHKIERLNAFVACMHPGEGHDPVFMICRSCRAVAENHAVPGDGAIGEAAREIGFAVERVMVEVEGLCPACQQDARP